MTFRRFPCAAMPVDGGAETCAWQKTSASSGVVAVRRRGGFRLARRLRGKQT